MQEAVDSGEHLSARYQKIRLLSHVNLFMISWEVATIVDRLDNMISV
jgi:hypothetical protein